MAEQGGSRFREKVAIVTGTGQAIAEGIVRDGALSIEEWGLVLVVSRAARFRMVKAVGEVVIAQGHGAITNAVSIAGLNGVSNVAVYAVSERGVVGLTGALAIDGAATACPSSRNETVI
jgi:NAD(P)-dependent dehydrogenase (short-subunit alcohol dehydrogenase family)